MCIRDRDKPKNQLALASGIRRTDKLGDALVCHKITQDSELDVYKRQYEMFSEKRIGLFLSSILVSLTSLAAKSTASLRQRMPSI